MRWRYLHERGEDLPTTHQAWPGTAAPGDEMITLYGLERVLSRLAPTRFVNDFSLKGGVLLAAFSMRRRGVPRIWDVLFF